MKGTQKIALDPRLWVFVGIIMFSFGLFFFLNNGQGILLLMVGFLIEFTALYIWVVKTIWKSRKAEQQEQALPYMKPTEENTEISYPEPLLTPSQVSNTDQSLPNTANETPVYSLESRETDREPGSTLILQIDEEPLTLTHLISTLSAFLSLYVKMWLLQQERFADFVTYTEFKDHRFEEEANLPIAELTYNSPAVISIPIDKIPKAFAEALRILIDTFTQLKSRIDLMKEEAIKAHLENNALRLGVLEKTAEMIDKFPLKLNQEEEEIVRQSLAVDIIQLLKDCNLEISGKPHHLTPVQNPSLVPSSLIKDLERMKAEEQVQAKEFEFAQ